ncbi:MAG: substrate-binding domain-containing protein [Rectinemataceae bacterium]
MKRLLGVLLLVLAFAGMATAADKKLVFYWISHGSAGYPIWVYAINGANAAGKALNVTVKTSFHNNDVASEKEAFQAAIAAKADGIAVSSPQDGAFKNEVALAKSKGIPVVFFNTDDPATGRDAYVGANVFQVGFQWAKYLVDRKLVKSGDKVWMPVEVPGATYQTEETRGIASVFDPLGIKYEILDAGTDPARMIATMTDYLAAHGNEIAAMIGLGDNVAGATKKVFDAVNWKAGRIPVVGWGNSVEAATAVRDGYMNAATWQYPDSQGFQPIVLLYMMKNNIATGYDVLTMAMYDKSNAATYLELAKKMK